MIKAQPGGCCDNCGADNRDLVLVGRSYSETCICGQCAVDACRALGLDSQALANRIADWIDTNATTPREGVRVVDAVQLLVFVQGATGADWAEMLSLRKRPK